MRQSVRKTICFDDEESNPGDDTSKIDFEVDQVFEGHELDVTSILVYPGCEKLVSASADDTIRVWDLDSGKCEKVITDHEGPVRHIIKFDKEVFLSCSWDAKICAFSILGPSYSKLKEFSMNSVSVYQLLKLKDERDFFVSINENDEIFVISYSQNKIIQKLESQKVCDHSKIKNSVNYPYHFYVSCSKYGKNKILCISYKENKKVKTYKKHGKDCEVLSLEVFLNNSGDEMLIVGGSDSVLYFYTTASGKYSSGLTKKIRCSSVLTSCFLFGSCQFGIFNKLYSFNGTSDGEIECWELYSTKHSLFRRCGSVKVFEKEEKHAIFDIGKYFFDNSENVLMVICASENKLLKFVKIEGISYFGADKDEEGTKGEVVKQQKQEPIAKPVIQENSTPVVEKKEIPVTKKETTKSVTTASTNVKVPLPSNISKSPNSKKSPISSPPIRKSNDTLAPGLKKDFSETKIQKRVSGGSSSPGSKRSSKSSLGGGDEKTDDALNEIIMMKKHLQEKDDLIQVFLKRLKEKDRIIQKLQLKIAKIKQIVTDGDDIIVSEKKD